MADNLEQRVTKIEAQLRGDADADPIDIGSLPLSALYNDLEFHWSPEGRQLVQAKSITHDEIGVLPSCRIYRATSQTIAQGAFAAVQFNAAEYDTAQMADTTNNRIAIRYSGIYVLTASAQFIATLNMIRTGLAILTSLQGAAYVTRAYSETNEGGGAANDSHSVATLFRLSAGDYVQAQVFHASTAAANADILGDASHMLHLAAHWVGTGDTA